MTRWLYIFLSVLILCFATSCEDDDSGGSATGRPAGDAAAEGGAVDGGAGDAGAGDAAAGGETAGSDTATDTGTDAGQSGTTHASPNRVPAGFAGVHWLHTNVSGWSQTASLSAKVSGSSMVLSYNKSRTWPTRIVNGVSVNANPWIFVYRNGAWYAATWEWLRPGQTSKAVSSVAGNHIKKSPLNNFVPQSGEVYGFMVSGLARDRTRNVQERSNVSMVRWP